MLQNVSDEVQKTAESIAGAAPEIADKVSNRITREADQVNQYVLEASAASRQVCIQLILTLPV